MGTSTSYTAPTSGGWPVAKSMATRFARQGGTDGGSIEPGSVVRSYVQALGGSVAAAAGALAGQTSATRFGNFLSSVATSGLNIALQNEGLAVLSGSSTTDVLAELVTRFTESGTTLDAAAARAAMVTVLTEEFDQMETVADLDERFAQRLDAGGIASVLERFLVEYIYQKMIEQLGDRLLSGVATMKNLRHMERDLHAFIVEDVKLEIAQQDLLTFQWKSRQTQHMIEQLLSDAYGQLE